MLPTYGSSMPPSMGARNQLLPYLHAREGGLSSSGWTWRDAMLLIVDPDGTWLSVMLRATAPVLRAYLDRDHCCGARQGYSRVRNGYSIDTERVPKAPQGFRVCAARKSSA